jgi:deazaflavin-dependent oxidoreductase (nitroreductase family)
MQPSLIRRLGALNAWIYRLSGGRLLGRVRTGAPVCLLTTIGRKSGQRRTVPLLYLADGDDLIVVGSQGGAPVHPAWYLNLTAEPMAEVEIGSRRFPVAARRLDDDEVVAIWPRVLAMWPPYEEYQRRTSRRIPLIRLSPA